MRRKANKTNILEGSISKGLFKLALPVVLTSLISIGYSLTDTWFIGKYLGDKYVSAVAAGAFFINFGMCFCNIPKIGAQVLVAQSIGARKITTARKYVRTALYLCVAFGLMYCAFVMIFHNYLIKVIKVQDPVIVNAANQFLMISAAGFAFLYLVITVSSIINAEGDTLGPFIFNSVGLLLNVLLDFIFIKYFKMGVIGAAAATVTAQAAACTGILCYLFRKTSRFRKLRIWRLDPAHYYRRIVKLGIPNGVNQALFSVFAIILAGMIASINETALGVQRVGIQFEAFSWNISIGLASAISAFVGQNYGARNLERLKSGYFMGLKCIVSIGFVISAVFIFGGKYLYGFFFENPETIAMGQDYLRILGFSQMFMCAEITTTGAFNGVGRTLQPTVNSVATTSLRIPLAYILTLLMGLTGIWWSISGTSILKGIISVVWFLWTLRKIKSSGEMLKELAA
ncbi:MAG: MATE family efflux transporter [Fusobacteriales bacterium]|jgi:putative MATE family efflux protein|nr:MATE family efflux transporter [Fusobacteriales bacterium]